MPITLRAGLLCLVTWMFAASTPVAATPPPYRLAVWPSNLPTPDFALRDDTGAHRSVRDYRGKILLVFFGFVQCPDACPIELLKLSQAMKQLGPLSDRVRLVFITLDPKHDTAAELKKYLANFDPRFAGLTGTVAEPLHRHVCAGFRRDAASGRW
jgi:cytochrome oxidase Cu insertion factor (SCO1/SenC/PrrC family)